MNLLTTTSTNLTVYNCVSSVKSNPTVVCRFFRFHLSTYGGVGE